MRDIRMLILIATLLPAVFLWAEAIPVQLEYQGKLTDATGIAMNGDHDITFKIYDVSTGGSALWTENHNGTDAPKVSITNGLFSVVLGSGVSMSSLDFSIAYYLELTVETEVLSPRQKLVPAPYAMRALNGSDDNDWTINRKKKKKKVYTNDTADSVGIGTTTPDGKLDVEGSGIYVSEIAAPGTPGTDKGVLYEQLDGKVYFKNDAGTEYDLTAAGGGSTQWEDNGTNAYKRPLFASVANDNVRAYDSGEQYGLYALNTRSSSTNYGVYGEANSNNDYQYGLYGKAYINSVNSYDGYGVYGEADCNDHATGWSADGWGGYFKGDGDYRGYGVEARGTGDDTGYGVWAYGYSNSGESYGIYTRGAGIGTVSYGIYALTSASATVNWAGYFNGNMAVTKYINIQDMAAPAAGNRLYANSGNLYWDGTQLNTGAGSMALNDLTDVTITSAATGDILYYNGSAWVDLAKGTDGQVLKSTATSIEWGTASSGTGGSCSGNTIFGENTTDIPYYPFYGFYNYSRSMELIQYSELVCTGGTIEKLAIYVGSANTHNFTNIEIRMKESPLAEFPSSPSWDGTGTLVWSGSAQFNAEGWHLFTLSSPFVWSSDNLLITFQWGGSNSINYPQFDTTGQTSYLQAYGYHDSGYPSSFSRTKDRANVRLTFATSSGGGGPRTFYTTHLPTGGRANYYPPGDYYRTYQGSAAEGPPYVYAYTNTAYDFVMDIIPPEIPESGTIKLLSIDFKFYNQFSATSYYAAYVDDVNWDSATTAPSRTEIVNSSWTGSSYNAVSWSGEQVITTDETVRITYDCDASSSFQDYRFYGVRCKWYVEY